MVELNFTGSMLLGAYIVALASKENNTQAGRRFIIGSCKYKNEKTDIDELHLIQYYASLFTNTNDECFYYIFSKAGFTDELLEKQTKGEVRLVTLEEMYGITNS
jgi:hypothetical protein